MHEPSLREAQAVAVSAQGLHPSTLAQGAHANLRALGCIQLDTINVVRRSHELVQLARGVAPSDARRLIDDADPPVLFEYWAHAASLIPQLLSLPSPLSPRCSATGCPTSRPRPLPVIERGTTHPLNHEAGHLVATCGRLPAARAPRKSHRQYPLGPGHQGDRADRVHQGPRRRPHWLDQLASSGLAPLIGIATALREDQQAVNHRIAGDLRARPSTTRPYEIRLKPLGASGSIMTRPWVSRSFVSHRKAGPLWPSRCARRRGDGQFQKARNGGGRWLTTAPGVAMALPHGHDSEYEDVSDTCFAGSYSSTPWRWAP